MRVGLAIVRSSRKEARTMGERTPLAVVLADPSPYSNIP